jgi:hypothetical protein
MKGPNNFTYCTIWIWGFSMQVLQGLVGLMMNEWMDEACWKAQGIETS